MSYGYGSTRRLRFIVGLLGQYVSGHINGSRKPLARRFDSALPPPLALSIMRGEAILRMRFISYFESIGFSLDDPEHLWMLWNKLVVERGRIHDLVNRIGLIAAISTQMRLPAPDEELAYQLYCGLIDDLERSKEYRLLEIATDYFFRHAFLSMFPNKAPEKKVARSPEGLRASVIARLRKQLKRPFELKESFYQGDEQVEFSLRLKLDGHWSCFPSHIGKRLKPTRLGAYEHLLEALESGSFTEWINKQPG